MIINEKLTQQCDIGIMGLGVMGCNLALNMADHGFKVAGYDKDSQKVAVLKQKQAQNINSQYTLPEFIKLLKKPRAILLLVPAGPIVDDVINELIEYIEPKDIIIDAGNSFFKDTDRRHDQLMAKGIYFLGVGVSGGEMGARLGPSIMPGGPKEAYESVRVIFESIAAKADNEPCVAYLGPKSAGHYVKMVHNGIEYGVMQLIAESYDLMKRGFHYSNERLQDVYSQWNNGELSSYLLGITSQILKEVDKETGKRLIDEISDVARQKGTGMWTTQNAMELQVPIPIIDLAVAMRDLSAFQKERRILTQLYPSPHFTPGNEKQAIVDLREALFIAISLVYAQGMSLLCRASTHYNYQLNLETIATIWRGGCIIRSALLERIKKAFADNPNLNTLLSDRYFSQIINQYQDSLRRTLILAIELGIPAPGLMASLAYLDAFRSEQLPTNLIQAQRDYFGAHTYERIDKTGFFHTQWEEHS
jgi:6-phosphogluconate dehydrogenase